jgi:hypothetical protein
MNRFQTKVAFWILSTFGVYCLVQGLMLLGSDDFLKSALGVGLLLWIPGCGYYAWRCRPAFATSVSNPRELSNAIPESPYVDVEEVA